MPRITPQHLPAILFVAISLALLASLSAHSGIPDHKPGIGAECDADQPVAAGMLCEKGTVVPTVRAGTPHWADYGGLAPPAALKLQKAESAYGAFCYYLDTDSTLVCYYGPAAARRKLQAETGTRKATK